MDDVPDLPDDHVNLRKLIRLQRFLHSVPLERRSLELLKKELDDDQEAEELEEEWQIL